MTNEEAIKTIKIAMSEVEWNYPMDYAIAFENAISALEKQIKLENVLDLINRQKAEIERLKHRKTELQIRNQELQHEKSEAIKEFAERLTNIICDNLSRSLDNPNGNDYFITDVYTTINNLVKEMTEVNKNDKM